MTHKIKIVNNEVKKLKLIQKLGNYKTLLQKIFWTPGLLVGVHSNRPCPSVHLSVGLSVFKYLRDCSLVFSETLHEVRGQLSKKSDTAEILKKNLNMGIKGDWVPKTLHEVRGQLMVEKSEPPPWAKLSWKKS